MSVPEGNDLGPPGRNFRLGSPPSLGSWGGCCYRQAAWAVAVCRLVSPQWKLSAKTSRNRTFMFCLTQLQYPGGKRPSFRPAHRSTRPVLVEVMKQSRIDARPVMYWHGLLLPLSHPHSQECGLTSPNPHSGECGCGSLALFLTALPALNRRSFTVVPSSNPRSFSRSLRLWKRASSCIRTELSTSISMTPRRMPTKRVCWAVFASTAFSQAFSRCSRA